MFSLKKASPRAYFIQGGRLFLPLTDKILFKTSISTRLRFHTEYLRKILLQRRYEIIDIFSHKDLEDEVSSFFEKDFCHIKDRDVQLYRAILIDSLHTRRRWSDIRSDQIKLIDPERFKEDFYFFKFKNILLKEVNIWVSEIFIDLLDIDPHHLGLTSDDLRDHLEKASWCGCHIEDIHPRFDDLIFFLDLQKFKRTSSTIPKFFGFFEVGVLDVESFWHRKKF